MSEMRCRNRAVGVRRSEFIGEEGSGSWVQGEMGELWVRRGVCMMEGE